MGHPLGATGAMLLGTAIDELEEETSTLLLLLMCCCMGIATIIERA